MIKIACDLTTVKCTKDARRWLQKFALPATKLRKNVKAPSAGCCESLLFNKNLNWEPLGNYKQDKWLSAWYWWSILYDVFIPEPEMQKSFKKCKRNPRVSGLCCPPDSCSRLNHSVQEFERFSAETENTWLKLVFFEDARCFIRKKHWSLFRNCKSVIL